MKSVYPPQQHLGSGSRKAVRVRVPPSALNARVAGDPGKMKMSDYHHVTLVAWAFAPAQLTLADAAHLLGRDYTPGGVAALIEIGAIDAELDDAGGWLVDKESLRAWLDALVEVVSDE